MKRIILLLVLLTSFAFPQKIWRNWTKISGSWSIGQTTTDEGIVKKGTKYLQNTVAGIVAFKSDQAYGRWSFDVYKGGANNNFFFYPISDRISNGNSLLGYRFFLQDDERIYADRANNGSSNLLFYTNTNYVANSTWYHIDIERTTAGVFSVWITGGAFTTKTLVSISGGGGTNPTSADNAYTTSKWFVLDLDANDRFTNLRMYKNLMVQ
jgi:hypothetical protein